MSLRHAFMIIASFAFIGSSLAQPTTTAQKTNPKADPPVIDVQVWGNPASDKANPAPRPKVHDLRVVPALEPTSPKSRPDTHGWTKGTADSGQVAPKSRPDTHGWTKGTPDSGQALPKSRPGLHDVNRLVTTGSGQAAPKSRPDLHGWTKGSAGSGSAPPAPRPNVHRWLDSDGDLGGPLSGKNRPGDHNLVEGPSGNAGSGSAIPGADRPKTFVFSDFVVEYTIQGGLAGVDDFLTIDDGGLVHYGQARLGVSKIYRAQLTPLELDLIRFTFEAAQFSELPRQFFPDDLILDGVYFSVTYTDARGCGFRVLSETGAVEDERFTCVREMLDRVIEDVVAGRR